MSNPSASKKATSIASAITSFVLRINEQSWARAVRVAVVVAGLGILLPTGSGMADAGASSERMAFLRHRLEQLEAREDAAYAEGPLEQARRALQIASAPAENAAASARAQEIARAALVLADRQLERRLAEGRLLETERRLAANRERAKAQRLALEALMRERASLARGEQR